MATAAPRAPRARPDASTVITYDPNGWVKLPYGVGRGKEYLPPMSPLVTYVEAANYCESHGGRVFSPNDRNENLWVWQLAENQNHGFWIGLTRDDTADAKFEVSIPRRFVNLLLDITM